MLKFYKLTEKKIKEFQNYTKNSKYPFCDYSVGVIFTWYKGFKAKYAVYNDTLIIKVGDKTPRFLMPLGNDVDGAIKAIENYSIEKKIPLKFMSVSDEWVDVLIKRYQGKIKSRFNRDYSDYVYNYEEMATFSGKKFSGQRNHINSFKKQNENYTVKGIEKSSIKEIKSFLKEYKNQYKHMTGSENKEFKYTKKLLKLTLKSDLFGMQLKINDKVAGVSIGEYVGNMLVIHVEKALTKYKGIYPTLFNEFTKFAKKEGIIYVNREDDSGDLGLRTSKTQYKPIKIENKNIVEIKLI